LARKKAVAPPAKTGRPTKYTPEIVKAILTALAIGNTAEDSCAAQGVGYSTMREWVGIYPEFAEAVQKAQAEARQRMVGVVAKAAAGGNWQAAMTYLERRDPEHWARRDRLDVAVNVRKEAERIAAENDLSVDEVMAEANRILERHT
jgi:hypothetical protein